MSSISTMNRRQWLTRAGAATLALGGWPWQACSATPSGPDPRLVVMVLRGGLDGLFAVPAVGDPRFASARGPLAEWAQSPLPLDGLFAMHPSWPTLHALFVQKQLIVAHAMGLPYQERSHFDAQNVLDTGSQQPFAIKDGWLNRAVQAWAAPGANPAGQDPRAVALSSSIPLMLQGGASVSNWSGGHFSEVSTDTLDRLARLYRADPALSTALNRARAVMEMSDELTGDPVMAGRTARRAAPGATSLVGAARQAAQFLSSPQGPRWALMEAGGWDSHINQTLPQGQLMRNLASLDQAVNVLQTELKDVWAHTVVMVVTEFGRTVHANGTGGTDHGVGMMALLAGGAVQGGQVRADWPGLAPADLWEGRDLRPTHDLRAMIKGVLADHLRLSRASLDTVVFPGSATVSPWRGLIRAQG